MEHIEATVSSSTRIPGKIRVSEAPPAHIPNRSANTGTRREERAKRSPGRSGSGRSAGTSSRRADRLEKERFHFLPPGILRRTQGNDQDVQPRSDLRVKAERFPDQPLPPVSLHRVAHLVRDADREPGNVQIVPPKEETDPPAHDPLSIPVCKIDVRLAGQAPFSRIAVLHPASLPILPCRLNSPRLRQSL